MTMQTHSHVVQIIVTEPWEVGDMPRRAKVLDEKNNALLVEYEIPFQYKNTTCKFFVLSPRHENVEIQTALVGKSVLCGMTLITPEQRMGNNPFDLRLWRGGVAFIADIQGVE